MRNESCEFINDYEFVKMNSQVDEIDQLKVMLESIAKVHNLTFQKFDQFDQLIHEYLKLGIEVFNMETGIVSEINGEEYKVCDVISPLEILEKNMTFPLEDTYCREVKNYQCIIGFPNVGSICRMVCHPVYQNLKLEAYLSSPIYVDEKLFGTLNFTSTEPREYGFSINEYNMIKIMANAIGSYISLRNKEKDLLNKNNQLKKFVGHVAHDLRNPLGSIISLVKLAKKPNLTTEKLMTFLDYIQTSSETALELVVSILEQMALGTGVINLDKQDILISEIVSGSIRDTLVFSENMNKKIIVNTEELIVKCDLNRIVQCLNNLIINALKYSPINSEIYLTSKKVGNSCVIEIKNQINDYYKDDTKQSLHKSYGFGIEIVENVLKAHSAKLDIKKDDGEYIANFKLELA